MTYSAFRTLLFSALVLFLFAGKPAPIDNPPARSTHNPLLPEPDQLFDFAKVDPAAIETAAMYTENQVTQLLAQIQASNANDNATQTFDNTMMPLDEIYNQLQKATSVYELLSATATDKTIRDKSGEMLEKFNTKTDELLQNEALYRAVKNYSQTAEAKSLSGERAFFVQRMLKEFELNGMNLSSTDRDTLKSINSRLNKLSVEFGKNIAEYKKPVMFQGDQLAGLSENFKKQFEVTTSEDGKALTVPGYQFDLSTPTYTEFMTTCSNAQSRKSMYIEKMNVGGEKNEKLLVDIIRLRTQKAKLLGFKTYSGYATADIMSQNSENVWKFEKGLATDLRPKAEEDLKLMLEEKSKYGATEEDKKKIYPYDIYYYSNLLLKDRFSVDQDKVKEYFTMDNALNGIFTVYQKLYNLRFVEDKNPSTWFKDVKAYSVFDNSTNERIGYFYLDLYPRPDKYNHFGCFGLTGSKKFRDGKKQLHSAALVCNFPLPGKDQPSLLTHSMMATFFHEFGHLIHIMLSETELAAFAGTNVATDFVEAPSQIMENWVWRKDVLSLFAKHYKTGEIIPDTLLDHMIAARNLNSGLSTLQQVYYGTLDFTLNDGFAPASSGEIVNKTKELQNSITYYPWVEGTHFAGTFGHLTGYGSKYYGYLWSLVYAADMFSVFEKNGPLSPETGKRYRENVLAKGGSDNALNLVRNFLGREPDNKAFLKQIGMKK